MALLRLRLFGTFEATCAGQVVGQFRSDKSRALLAYLAIEGDRPHQRDSLAALLWGEYGQQAARSSLRQTLSNLRQALAPLLEADPPLLRITPQSVALQGDSDAVWSDVQVLQALLARCQAHSHPTLAACATCQERLRAAADLYQGDFLPGLHLPDSPAFEEWRLLWQERLQQQAEQILAALVEASLARQAWETAQDYLRQQLRLTPWHEQAHRGLMELLARSGQRSQALAQYEICRQILRDELGVDPETETTALYEAIKAGKISPPAPRPPAAPSHNLPPATTPFFGYQAALADLEALFADGAYRLITLTGPGGIGKTRLALAAGQRALAHFAQGVWVVPLAGLVQESEATEEEARLATAVAHQIAAALHIPLSGTAVPQDTLFEALSGRRLLLLLDNLEQLLPAITPFLLDLLDRAPHVTLLVTSQSRLNCRAERVLPLIGLALPDPAADAASQRQSDSARFFVDRAARVYSSFDLAEADLPHVVAICRLLGGTPLGIELAASLTAHYTPAEIAEAIRHNLDLLADAPGLADMPPRQRSLQAVFDYTWALLRPPEQAVLAQTAVFPAEFSRAAALSITHASLGDLMALVDKSLLRPVQSGRYLMHGLVRQYAAAQLAGRAGEETAVAARFVHYFATFMQQRLGEMDGPQQIAAQQEVRQELDNVRQAWRLAGEAQDEAALSALAEPLGRFCDDQGYHQEGVELFTAVADLPGLSPECATRLRLWLGFFHYRLAHYPQSQALLTQALADEAGLTPPTRSFGHYVLGCLLLEWGQLEAAQRQLQTAAALAEAAQNSIAQANTFTSLGRLHELIGQYDQAREMLLRSLALKRQAGAPRPIANSLNNLALLLQRQGENEAARRHLQESLSIVEALGNQPDIGAALANLGMVEVSLRRYESAAALLRQALAIQEKMGNRARMAIALNNLGDVANQLGDYQAGIAYLQQSLAIKEEMGNRRGMTFSLVHLGHAYLALGQTEEARRCYWRTLALAQELEMPPLLLAGLVGWAQLTAQDGDVAEAVRLLQLPLRHPSSWQRVREEGEEVETAVLTTHPLPPDQLAAARADGQALDLATAVTRILTGDTHVP